MTDKNLTPSYRTLQIAKSTELLDMSSRCANWGAKALISDYLIRAARHDASLHHAMIELAAEAEAQESAMIEFYTGADRSADADAQHYGIAA